MTESTSTQRKQRTITLTGRPPVKIYDDEWPVIAVAQDSRCDNPAVPFQANEDWSEFVRVRKHTDGRALVYGRATYSTQFEGRNGYTHHGGELLAANGDVVAAIRRVVADLGERAGLDLTELAHDCIGDLPAEQI